MKTITNREKQVLKYLANGFSVKEIALELFISEHTVSSHKKNLIQKFSARNTPNLIFLAGKNRHL